MLATLTPRISAPWLTHSGPPPLKIMQEATRFADRLIHGEDPAKVAADLHEPLVQWEESPLAQDAARKVAQAKHMLHADSQGVMQLIRSLLDVAYTVGPEIRANMLTDASPAEKPQSQAVIDPEILQRFPIPDNPDHLPDYPGWSVGRRTSVGGVTLEMQVLPHSSENNFLVFFSGGDCRGYNCILPGFLEAIEAPKHGSRVFAAINGISSATAKRPQFAEITGRFGRDLDRAHRLALGTGKRNRDPWAALDGRIELDALKGNETELLDNFLRNVAPFLGGIAIIGGNNSIKMAERIHSETAIPCNAAGATMDFDVIGTQWTVGGDTAVKEAARQIRNIAVSAGGCNTLHIVQTFGGNSGRFPLEAAIDAGAESVIIPELGIVDLEHIYPVLFRSILKGDGAVLVIGERGAYRDLTGEVVRFRPQKGVSRNSVLQQLTETIESEMRQIAVQRYPNLGIEQRGQFLFHVLRESDDLQRSDLARGRDVGRRLARSLIDRQFGYMVPGLPHEELIPLNRLHTKTAYREAQKPVLTNWLQYYGDTHKELGAILRRHP